ALIGTAAVRIAAEWDVPTIATLHSLPENAVGVGDHRSWLFKAVSKGFWDAVASHCRRCTRISAPSELARGLLLDHGVPGPITVISNGVDVRRFRPASSTAERLAARRALGWPEQGRIVLYVGRLASEKRIDVLLEASRLLPKSLDATTVFVGKGDPAYQELAGQLGVADRCRFHGPVSDDELPLTYRAADLFAFPSEAELQGMVLLEAAASGLPLVAAHRYAIPEIVHHGVNGYLHAPGDAAGCAEAIATVLESDRIYRRLSRLAVRFAADHDLNEVAARTETLYEAAIADQLGVPLASTA
ncbi:MAG TPA: glycosyltransferase, partial [Planctomycetaceae bacterium]